MSRDDETIMEFPCEFPIKAMGAAVEDFEVVVMEIVKQHVPGLTAGQLKQRPSKNGKYVSITVTIEAHSKAQLDAIYIDLTACEKVLMAL